MVVEVINTGTELLLGNTLNTHLVFLGQELFPLGLRIARQAAVPDGEAIRDALTEAMGRAEIILVTGGLGPTTDDVTREIVAEMFGMPLREDAAVWEHIRERFARRGLALNERNRRQAQVPGDARVLWNPHGTAPGLYFARGNRHIFLMPGPPRELRPMFRDVVAPILKEIVPGGATFASRRWLVCGMGESGVEAAVGEPLLAIPGLELGYCARPGVVEVRCIGTPEALAKAEAVVTKTLSANLAGEGSDSLEELLVPRLAALGRKLATAESCTGGRLAHKITGVPGASVVFDAGFVTYANAEKTRALGVPAALIAEHGAVSEPVARAMAEGALERTGADFALATTGIAGPDGGTAEKPVGTVYIALAIRGGETRAARHFYPMDRLTFQDMASNAALNMLREALG